MNVAASIPSFPARFILILLAVLGLCTVVSHAKGDHHCEPSSCGHIRNISYPFRLNDDPKKCGKSRYNLSCENNVTVLHLYSGKYYVLAINYGNATIRVVDANVREGHCCSIPRNSLASYNFSDEDPYSIDIWKGAKWGNADRFELSKPIIFMTCETRPVNSSLYVDTAPCINATSGHSFVISGGLNASDLWDSCRIELMVLTSWSIGAKDMNSSYMDIHKELLYGFELSLLESYRRSGYYFYWPWEPCYLDIDTNRVYCAGHAGIVKFLIESASKILTAGALSHFSPYKQP